MSEPDQPMRIWVLNMAFKKNGFPSVGSFGQRIAGVVILPIESWTRLCQEIPALGARQFEVGSENEESSGEP
jgi:hypothetical protein